MDKRRYWLMKSEPESYGIGHLKADKKTAWTGVRNFLARNHMRAMSKGDGILFYHSSCAVPGVYGIAKVASAPYPDPTQFDPSGRYFEKRATQEKSVWDLVDIAYESKLEQPVTITAMRGNPKLRDMEVLRKGSRLSVTPVTEKEFEEVLRMAA